MYNLTKSELSLLTKVYESCLTNRFGIASIRRDEWAVAQSLVELELLEFHCLVNDRAWRLTENGIRFMRLTANLSGLLFSQRQSLATAAEKLCRAKGWDINSVNLVTALDVLARSVGT